MPGIFAQIQLLERRDNNRIDIGPLLVWDCMFEMQLQNVPVDGGASSSRAAVWWWNPMFGESFIGIRHEKTRPWKEVSGENARGRRLVVRYLPSFCWCLLSDFRAAWMRSWWKMSLWRKINKTNVNLWVNARLRTVSQPLSSTRGGLCAGQPSSGTNFDVRKKMDCWRSHQHP